VTRSCRCLYYCVFRAPFSTRSPLLPSHVPSPPTSTLFGVTPTSIRIDIGFKLFVDRLPSAHRHAVCAARDGHAGTGRWRPSRSRACSWCVCRHRPAAAGCGRPVTVPALGMHMASFRAPPGTFSRYVDVLVLLADFDFRNPIDVLLKGVFLKKTSCLYDPLLHRN
jgi:hypothetical protein